MKKKKEGSQVCATYIRSKEIIYANSHLVIA